MFGFQSRRARKDDKQALRFIDEPERLRADHDPGDTVTSGVLIFCASRPATVPRARMRPHESSVWLAISREADASNCRAAFLSDRRCASDYLLRM
jgi:hypothetical protein